MVKSFWKYEFDEDRWVRNLWRCEDYYTINFAVSDDEHHINSFNFNYKNVKLYFLFSYYHFNLIYKFIIFYNNIQKCIIRQDKATIFSILYEEFHETLQLVVGEYT